MIEEIKIKVYYTEEESGKKLVDTDSIREDFERQLSEVLEEDLADDVCGNCGKDLDKTKYYHNEIYYCEECWKKYANQ